MIQLILDEHLMKWWNYCNQLVLRIHGIN